MSSPRGTGQDATQTGPSRATIAGVDPAFRAVLAFAGSMIRILFLIPPLLFARADAAAPGLDDVVAHAAREVAGSREGFEDSPLTEVVQRAMIEATGARVALSAPPPLGTRILPGPVTVRTVFGLVPSDLRLHVVALSGSQIEELLERTAGRFVGYTYEHGRPLLEPGEADSLIDAFEGLSYEIDLSRPKGERVIHLAFRGASLEPDSVLDIAVDERRLARGDLPFRPGKSEPVWLKDALLAHVRRVGTLDAALDRNWSILPDYAVEPERPLIDRLVRMGVAPPEEVHRLFPEQPARRGDLAYWLARAFGWREPRLSGAFPDVPDSLEPWLDGLVRRRLLGSVASAEFFLPFATASLPLAFEWLENAARHEHYALETAEQSRAFRRGLLAGTSLAVGGGGPAVDTLTRAQMLGLVANLRFPTLRVLETSDFHGALLPRDQGGRPRGGAARLAAHIERLRGENPEGTVLLDGGDMFQGTMISNLAHGRPVVEHMNRLGYAAAAIGNHDFDWSADTLARRVSEMRFAALGANLLDRSGRRPAWARPDTLLVRRGVRVGVLGLCYRATGSVTLARHVAAFRFADDSAAAAAVAPALRRRGAQVVIGLGHIPGSVGPAGIGGDIARLARGVRGVDLWLGGHSHTRVAGEVAGVPVLVPGSHGLEIALCDVVVDPVKNRVVERHWRLVPVNGDDVTPDPAAAALVERWNRDIAPLAATPVGRNARRLTRTRGGESPVGSLVADAIRAATLADIALQNNGGLRAELPEGPVSRGAIYEVLPFENSLVTMELTGAEVRRAIEEGLVNERITQVSGVRYRFDLGALAFARVTALAGPDGQPLDEASTYVVAVNDFMAGGGDDYATLTRGRAMRDTGIGLRETLEDHVRRMSERGGAVDHSGDGRVTREPGSRLPALGD